MRQILDLPADTVSEQERMHGHCTVLDLLFNIIENKGWNLLRVNLLRAELQRI